MLVPAPTPTRSPVTDGDRSASRPLRLPRAGGSIAPLRRGHPVALGGVDERRVVAGCQLVAAQDLTGTAWWIPAAAVWSDARCDDATCVDGAHPTERPNAVGLATARTTPAAVLAGLSDRLGWEAVTALDHGVELAPLTGCGRDAGPELDGTTMTALDGRIGHDVPTVVVLGRDVVRWGAGGTWATAVRRALFGRHGPGDDDGAELAWLADRLGDHGLRPAFVDIGNDALRAAGVTRASVQLLAV